MSYSTLTAASAPSPPLVSSQRKIADSDRVLRNDESGGEPGEGKREATVAARESGQQQATPCEESRVSPEQSIAGGTRRSLR